MKKYAIPKTVWALGFVSLFMDISSEMIHSILPLYMIGTLSLSVFAIGIIEGIAEATSLIVKIFSGMLSDYIGKRKGLLLLGYGLAAFTKPLFPLASSSATVFTARFLDRIGKGLRGAPRDALIADVTPPEIRGASFGLRQSMDVIGAVLGPLIAFLLLYSYQNNIKLVLWLAILPAFIAVAVLFFGVQEKKQEKKTVNFPLSRQALKSFSKSYWWLIGIGGIFTLARFSEAFLVLQAREIGLEIMYIPLAMVMMSLLYTLSAYPAGILSDKLSRSILLCLSLLFLIIADFCMALANSPVLLFTGLAFWGLHLGFSQGILAAMIADNSPKELKGTAYGIFNLACGIAMLIASVLAGFLWEKSGAASTFYAGAFFAFCSLLLTLFYKIKFK